VCETAEPVPPTTPASVPVFDPGDVPGRPVVGDAGVPAPGVPGPVAVEEPAGPVVLRPPTTPPALGAVREATLIVRLAPFSEARAP
jgi:hypothetical protein